MVWNTKFGNVLSQIHECERASQEPTLSRPHVVQRPIEYSCCCQRGCGRDMGVNLAPIGSKRRDNYRGDGARGIFRSHQSVPNGIEDVLLCVAGGDWLWHCHRRGRYEEVEPRALHYMGQIHDFGTGNRQVSTVRFREQRLDLVFQVFVRTYTFEYQPIKTTPHVPQGVGGRDYSRRTIYTTQVQHRIDFGILHRNRQKLRGNMGAKKLAPNRVGTDEHDRYHLVRLRDVKSKKKLTHSTPPGYPLGRD